MPKKETHWITIPEETLHTPGTPRPEPGAKVKAA